MDSYTIDLKGIITFLSDDKCFGSIYCEEDGLEYPFVNRGCEEELFVGDNVMFNGFYSSQAMMNSAFSIRKYEPDMQLKMTV